MIVDFRNDGVSSLVKSLWDDKDYSDRLFDLALEGWALKKSPSNIFPGAWHSGSPYVDFHESLRVMSQYISGKPEDYAWWFALYSDETALSIDYFYPWRTSKGEVGIVYGIDFEQNDVFIHSHCHGDSDDDFAYLILETSVKVWAMKQHI